MTRSYLTGEGASVYGEGASVRAEYLQPQGQTPRPIDDVLKKPGGLLMIYFFFQI